jgi:MFS family permease
LEATNVTSATKGRSLWINAILFFAFFSFYFVFSIYVLPQTVDQPDMTLTVQAVFSFVIAVSIVASAFLIDKLNTFKVITLSLALTSVLMLMLILIHSSAYASFGSLLVFICSVVFGFGQLAFFVYFWEQHSGYGIGKVASKIGFLALIPYFILIAAVVENMGVYSSLMVALAPILIALIASLVYSKRKESYSRTPNTPIYHERRTVFLYAIPWFFFCLVNSTLAKNISIGSNQLVSSYFVPLSLIQTIASLVGVYSAGRIADVFGRRTALAFSVTLYGISMAFSGFVPNLISFSFAIAAEGLSWGMLLTLYSFVIWGDLANHKNCAKMYAIGLVAFYVAAAIGQLPTPLSEISPTNSALIACSIIFMSNTAILLAPELLPSDVRQKLRLRKYIDNVKKNEDKFRS